MCAWCGLCLCSKDCKLHAAMGILRIQVSPSALTLPAAIPVFRMLPLARGPWLGHRLFALFPTAVRRRKRQAIYMQAPILRWRAALPQGVGGHAVLCMLCTLRPRAAQAV